MLPPAQHAGAAGDQCRSNQRLKWLAVVVFAWAAIIIGRLIQLQILQHESYKELADSQQQREVELSAPRGSIEDRTGERLAISVPKESVVVDPLRIPDAGFAADILSRILDLDRDAVYRRLRFYADQGLGFLWIKRKVSDQEAERLRNLHFDWIEFRTETQRIYTYAGLAAHVLGGVDADQNGNAGVEQSLNDTLQGQPGYLKLTTDVRHRAYQSVLEREPAPGQTIRLTILARLQSLAEEELKNAVQEHHAKTGSLVAMDPHTGEIFAIANYPAYNPNEPPKSGAMTAREDLAVTAPFEPGSVFKVITISAALETTNLRPETVVPCGNGSITLFGRTIHDHSSYASLPVEDVLARSSNIGAINIGLKVGDAKLYDYVRRFGFGQRTGLALPGESPGMVRPLKRWEKSSIGSVAMGHEVSVTAVQLAQAAAVIANGGFLVKPRILMDAKADPPRRVIRPETAVTMRRMMEGVVTKPYGTAHCCVHIPGYSAAGKTGTAQIYDFKAHAYTHLYNASFMGFAPVNNPAVVVVVTLNGTSGTAGYGGPVSAPVFSKVTAAALRLLDIPKDLPDSSVPPVGKGKADENDVAIADLDPSGPQPLVPSDAETAPRVEAQLDQRFFFAKPEPEAEPEPEPDSSLGPKAPNFIGMTVREVARESAAAGVQVEFTGTGLVRAQYPPPGYELSEGEPIKLALGR